MVPLSFIAPETAVPRVICSDKGLPTELVTSTSSAATKAVSPVATKLLPAPVASTKAPRKIRSPTLRPVPPLLPFVVNSEPGLMVIPALPGLPEFELEPALDDAPAWLALLAPAVTTLLKNPVSDPLQALSANAVRLGSHR